MTQQFTPRMTKLLKYQHWAIIFNSLAAISVAIYLSVDHFGAGLLAFFASMAGAWVFSKALNTVSLLLFQFAIYKFDTTEMKRDAEEVLATLNNRAVDTWLREMPLTILNVPETPMGTFMGTVFYEWIDIKDEHDTVHRFLFEGTMDISGGLTAPIPQGCILLPPGILYQDARMINKPT